MSPFPTRRVFGALVCCLLLSGVCHAAEVVVDITRFSARKIPIAIPAFQVEPVSSSDLFRQAADRMSAYLDFTGFLKIIEPRLFPSQSPIGDESAINYANWRTLGAELMVVGNARMDGDLVEIELRLVDPFKQSLVLGKRYKGWTRDLPRIVRRFCAEIVYYLTGKWGVFDSRIAYVSNQTGNKEVFICDFDGSNPQQFTHHQSICLSPAWSSTGDWLAYTSYASGTPDLYIRHVSENRGTVVAKKGINTTPAWLPNAAMLSATMSFSGDPEIYLLNPMGQVVDQLTRQWGIDTSPTWAPDGRRFAFVSSRAGSPQIYIQERGGQAERLSFKGRYNTQPAWSPNGDKVAYSSMEGGEINIHLIDVATRETIQLTYGTSRNESPAWAPDGSLIAFGSTREGASHIYVMTAFGTDQRRLLTAPGEQFTPAWSLTARVDAD